MSEETERRHFLVGLGLAAAGTATAGAAVKKPDDTVELRAAFDTWVRSLNAGEGERFLGLHHAEAQFVDEDVPFRMSRTDFVDHLGFHDTRMWESFAWIPRSADVRRFGSTGIVAGQATFRGKPRDAGFRLRHLLYILGWTFDGGRWVVVSMHLSPMLGHVVAASPG